MAEERIQKIMAEQGLCSRRAAEQIIAEGRVKVNGHPVKVGDKMDPNRDVLHVDDERIYIQKNQQLYYLALYKPRGYVTTASDELGRKTVMELVSDIPARLYPVGRLDKDSEGLLLMTNDGAFAQAVTHPSGGISKLYRVTVQPRADESQILKMSSGVVLDDGTKTMPCAINVVTDEPGRTVCTILKGAGKLTRAIIGSLRFTRIDVVLGVRGEDPAEAARSYGRLNAWLYPTLGFLDRFLYLDFEQLRLLPDFGSAEPTVKDHVSFRVTARAYAIVFTLLRVLYAFWREKVLDVFI